MTNDASRRRAANTVSVLTNDREPKASPYSTVTLLARLRG